MSVTELVGPSAGAASARENTRGGALATASWVLDARELSKAYDGRVALDDVSLRLSAGQGVALLGPNGSGKTTLLSLLAGVLRPDHGSVLVTGIPSTRRRARRALALVPQDGAVYDGLSGEENVSFFARLHGLSGAALRERVRAALSVAGLSDRAAARAGTYSGGMRRRLSLACALVHAPSLLLLDEPFEGVDEVSRERLLSALQSAKSSGVALVLSTHRLEDVAALCERYCALRDGRIVAERALDGHEIPSQRAVMCEPGR